MKITGRRIFFGLVCFVLFSSATPAAAKDKTDRLFREALQWESKASYRKALELYQAARKEYLQAGQTELARKSREKIIKMGVILDTFSLTEEQALKKLDEVFENFSAPEKKELLKQVRGERMVIDGELRYFEAFLPNLFFRNPSLAARVPKFREGAREAARKYGDVIFRQLNNEYLLKSWNAYINPQTYMANVEIVVPKKQLAEKGTLRLWVPAPILLDAQRDVKILSISPQEYLKSPPRMDGDIGSAYFEIPLEKIGEELRVTLRFSFARCEQYFQIDPRNVGEYDRNSALYRQYTASGPNITVTPEIRKKALEIVGRETNPYLQARKLHFEVVEKYSYSFMPHLYLYQTGQSESLFVLKNGYGDCGSQAMFFAALCRSLGIPARAIGGMLLTPGAPSDHFWAEFYLSNYGWVPVDPTIDEAVLNSDELTPPQRRAVHEYFFGHLDNRRYVIQKDVDLMVQPRMKGKPEFGVTLQIPWAECDTMETSPMMPLANGYRFTVETSY